MNKKLAIVLVLAIIVVLALIVGGILLLNHSPKEKEPTSISFGYQPFGSNLAFYVAMEKGFFAKRGLSVTAEKIISANDAATAIINGKIVADATVPLNVILNIEENQPGLLKIFMWKASSSEGERWSDYLLVKKGSPIKSIADLKGKKVGGYPGTAQQVILKIILKQFMNESDIVTVELPPTTQLAALDNRQVDAIITYDEIAITALQTGVADVLVENPIGKYIINPYYSFPYAISADFVKKYPKTTKKIMEAMYESVDYINSHDGEVRQIMSKWVGTKPEIAQNVNLWAQVKSEDTNKEALQKLVMIFYQQGIIKSDMNTDQLILTLHDLK